MLISNSDAVDLHTAIKLTTGVKLDRQATWNMAKNARIVKGLVSDVEEARTRLIKQFDSTGTGTISAESKDWIPFISALQEVMNVVNEANILTIPVDRIPIEEVERLLTVEGSPAQTQALMGAFSMMIEDAPPAPARAPKYPLA